MRRPLSILVIAAALTALLSLPSPARAQEARDEQRGLVYDGMRRVPSGPCGPAFELVTHVTGRRARCTHGPDPAPPGVDVRQRKAVAAPPSNGQGSFAASQPGVPCYGNGSDGYRVQLLYVHPTGTANRLGSLYSSLVTWAANANLVFDLSAAKTGGIRQVRFLTDANCSLAINEVQVPTAAMNDFSVFINELDAQGFNHSDRRYLAWADANVYCGIAEVYADDSSNTIPGLPTSNANNANTQVPGLIARVDNGCWGMANSVEAHELVHTFGGVQPTAPNATQGFHCTDDADRMCYLDGTPPGTLFQRCTGTNDENRLDCNNDDYFNTSPVPGSYLATHWNVANSAFLAASDPGPPAGNPQGDPQQFHALTGVGADTTVDVMNALAGETNGTPYTTIQSSAATGYRQIGSWDATGSSCITPKAPGATFDRPHGSAAGRRALSRAIDGGTYGSVCGIKPVSGLIDFASSSAGPTTSTPSDLTYIPFGRDAVSFSYYANGVASPVTSLTRAQLTALFTSGPQQIGGVNVVPCGIQIDSGTYESWNAVTTATAAQEAAATATCRNATSTGQANGRVDENDGLALKAKGDALVGSEVVVGFSAAKFISMTNGAAASRLTSTGVDLGTISDNGAGASLGKPYSGAAPNLSPNAAFYNDAVFGRNVYNVFDTSRITGIGNNDLKSLFVGGTSALCSTPAQTIVNTFGFLSIASCGSTTTTGPKIAGTF